MASCGVAPTLNTYVVKDRSDYQFKWSVFLEGMLWPLLSIVMFGGIGVVAISNRDIASDNLWIGVLYIAAGTITTVVLTWACYDWAWERKDDE